MTNRRPRARRLAAIIVAVLVAVYLVRSRSTIPASSGGGTVEVPRPDGSAPTAVLPPVAVPTGEISAAFRARRSDVVVEGGGRVVRVLADDREGSRHERFLIRVDGGLSVLVAHNIDLAPRVPVAPGDSVELRGEYAWNAKGGVVHWTHRDPDGRHEPGWIRHAGRLYQ
ncbi:MAG TPA: DUF3465 domain-containing protein [Gemmatimonadales bacterium]|nr:DUF3465 domain-containing protein [Gemmatimonadales bacterium]